MSLRKLKKLVAPPSKPVTPVVAAQRGPIEIRGREISLPPDFLDYISAYGSGTWCDGYIYIESPVSPAYKWTTDTGLDVLQSSKDCELFDDPVHPEEGGLFPWGRDEHASTLAWATEGNPSDWPVVVHEHGGGLEWFHMPMTEFLYRSFVNDIAPVVWSDEPFEREGLNFHTSQRY